MPNILSNATWCLSYFEAKEQYRKALIEALLKLIEPTRAEAGCLQYELVIDNENPNFLIMVEKFISQTALDEHEKQPYIKYFVENEMDKYCHKVTWNVGKEIKK